MQQVVTQHNSEANSESHVVTSDDQTDIMNAYHKFVFTWSGQICHYLSPSSPVLYAKKGCHGLSRQPATKYQAAARSPLPFPPSGTGRRNAQKGKLMGWDKDSLIRQQKKYHYYY